MVIIGLVEKIILYNYYLERFRGEQILSHGRLKVEF